MNENLLSLSKEINSIYCSIIEVINKRAELIKTASELKDEISSQNLGFKLEMEKLENILSKSEKILYEKLSKEVDNFFVLSLAELKKNHDELLISSKSDTSFNSISDIFEIDNYGPILIAGPCAVENYEYLEIVAKFLKERNIGFIRAGAYKPRSSPYDFQGLREEGLKILHEVSNDYGLISVSEIVDTRDIELFEKYVDVMQIGARNMQNFELLKEAGRSNHPVILKRGVSSTIQEFMFSAEYIAAEGNRKIILCERGIRTFEKKTRNTLDVASIPIIKEETKLPIIADLSHSLGRKDIINSVAKAVLSAGADGIMVEVHPYPELALSDKKQQLRLSDFEQMLNSIHEQVEYLTNTSGAGEKLNV